MPHRFVSLAGTFTEGDDTMLRNHDEARPTRGERPLLVKLSAAALLAASALVAAAPADAGSMSIPLVCTKGPDGQSYQIAPQVPASAQAGSTYWVQIDGVSSGKISQTGLNYIFDMSYDYLLPSGARYVDGSAQIVAGTGSENARKGAKITHRNGIVTMTLPAHVDEGSAYTPPSFKLQLTAGAGGSAAKIAFKQYRVTANAFIVGDVHASCDPTPSPFTVGTTKFEAASGG